MLIKFFSSKKWMCQASIIKKVCIFKFMKTYLLQVCYQIAFCDDHNLDTIELVHVDFTYFRYNKEDILISLEILQSHKVEMDYLSVHIIYSNVKGLYWPSVFYIKIKKISW